MVIFDGNTSTAMRNVIEGNRIGPTGNPPDGNGANALVISSPANIIRYNDIFNAGEKGIHLKQASGADSENNRIYNNTAFENGTFDLVEEGTDNRWWNNDYETEQFVE